MFKLIFLSETKLMSKWNSTKSKFFEKYQNHEIVNFCENNNFEVILVF